MPTGSTDSRAVLAGILVGGGSRRMGGAPKGLLAAPDGSGSIVARLIRIVRQAALEPVLVGDLDAYDAVAPGIVRLRDRPAGIGPLGGLQALLEHAGDRGAIALACDLPVLSVALLARLASHPSAAPVVAPASLAKPGFEPLFARYQPAVLPHLRDAIARGERSPMRLLASLSVEELPLAPAERAELTDWDGPADLPPAV